MVSTCVNYRMQRPKPGDRRIPKICIQSAFPGLPSASPWICPVPATEPGWQGGHSKNPRPDGAPAPPRLPHCPDPEESLHLSELQVEDTCGSAAVWLQ